MTDINAFELQGERAFVRLQRLDQRLLVNEVLGEIPHTLFHFPIAIGRVVECACT